MNTSAVSQPSPSTQARAGFFVRLTAYSIDLGVIWAATSLLKPIVGALLPGAIHYLSEILINAMGDKSETQMQQLIALSQTVVTMSLVTSLYFLAEGIFGRALGKLALGLRVDRASGDSAAADPLRGTWLLRYFVKNAGALFLLLGLSTQVYGIYRTGEIIAQITVVGSLVALHRRRQALHDLVSGTAVFRAPRFGATRAIVGQ
jgi:uncharacterized RDD family membrane protein YckC